MCGVEEMSEKKKDKIVTMRNKIKSTITFRDYFLYVLIALQYCAKCTPNIRAAIMYCKYVQYPTVNLVFFPSKGNSFGVSFLIN